MKNNVLKSICMWTLLFMIVEFLFVVLISKSISGQLVANTFLTSLILGEIATLLTTLKRGNKIFMGLLLLVTGILYATQAVFYSIFKVYFSLYDLALQDQLGDFMKETITLIIRYFPYILIFLLPFLLFLILQKKYKVVRTTPYISYLLLLSIIGTLFARTVFVDFNKDKVYSTYDIEHNVNNISLSIKKLGVVNSYVLEGKRILFGYTPKNIKPVEIPKEKEIVEYEDNDRKLKLKDTDNETVKQLHSYIETEQKTSKNKYTGMFKGYNLVYITAESFSEIAVREDLTPTLYKLIHNGFVFKNFYTPNNLSTIGGEFQSLTGLYPDYSILKKWRNGTNAFPFGLGNIFRNLGYDTYAYHNNTYTFQDRNNYIASQGFTNFIGCGNGMENRINCYRWPQSDLEMMDATKEDYIHSENPFLAYYMTVSGHFAYTYSGNSIASQNRELVENLDLRESSKAYIATQIELDRALKNLIDSLEAEDKLDQTVFVLMADHYPYELEEEAIQELSTYERDNIEINHNALILWNPKVEKKEIEKPCMSSDVLPTIYNLFGVEYDSRLFTGKDILSNDFGIAILSDRSWITEEGVYNASENVFTPKQEVEDNYVETINQLVNNRLNISREIIENDYYSYLIVENE